MSKPVNLLPKLGLPIVIPLRGALYEIGQQAAATGTLEGAKIQAECLELASRVGDAKIPGKVPARDFLAQACDHFRREGSADAEALAEIERLIAAIKNGSNMAIIGQINYTAKDRTSAMRAIDNMAKQVDDHFKG